MCSDKDELGFVLPINSSATFTITGKLKEGVTQGGNIEVTLVPEIGYLNENSNNEVTITQPIVSGRVFEHKDINSKNIEKEPGINNATVVLARLNADKNWKPAIVTKTDAKGFYRFPITSRKDDYRIVTLSKTLSENNALWAEQSWGGAHSRCVRKNGKEESITVAGYCFGGRYPKSDIQTDMDALWQKYRNKCENNFCPEEPHIEQKEHHIWDGEHTIQLNNIYRFIESHPLGLTELDFGFSYDVVTNTNDSGQGSLRQFINNANAGAGLGKMLFAPVIPADGQKGYWQILLKVEPLAELTRGGLVLDGRGSALAPFKGHKGHSYTALNLGGAVPAPSLHERYQRPDLQIIASSGSSELLTMKGPNQQIKYFALKGKGYNTGINVNKEGTGAIIHSNNFGGGVFGAGSMSTGIKNEAKTQDLLIQENKFADMDTAIIFHGSGEINANTISDIHDIGIRLGNGDFNQDVKIKGNTIQLDTQDDPAGIAIDGSRLENVQSLRIVNNPVISGGNIRLSASGASNKMAPQ